MKKELLFQRYEPVTSIPSFFSIIMAKDTLGEYGFVLIKGCNPRDSFSSREYNFRVKLESEVLSRLSHVGLCEHIDSGVCPEDDSSYLITTWAEGFPLNSYFNQRTPRHTGQILLLGELLEALDQLADLLVYVHSQGVFHNDIQRDNLIWDRNKRRLKLVDWSNCVLGIGGNSLKAEENDLFQYGTLMFELVTGRHLNANHLHRRREWQAVLDKMQIDKALRNIIIRAIDREENFYRSMEQLAEDLHLYKERKFKAYKSGIFQIQTLLAITKKSNDFQAFTKAKKLFKWVAEFDPSLVINEQQEIMFIALEKADELWSGFFESDNSEEQHHILDKINKIVHDTAQLFEQLHNGIWIDVPQDVIGKLRQQEKKLSFVKELFLMLLGIEDLWNRFSENDNLEEQHHILDLITKHLEDAFQLLDRVSTNQFPLRHGFRTIVNRLEEWTDEVKKQKQQSNKVIAVLSKIGQATEEGDLATAMSIYKKSPGVVRNISSPTLSRLSLLAKSELEEIKKRTPIIRYSNISVPREMEVNKTYGLRVEVDLQPTGETSSELILEPSTKGDKSLIVDVLLSFGTEDFTSSDTNFQKIKVPLDKISEPILFDLTPKTSGTKVVNIEFFQENRYLGGNKVKILVRKLNVVEQSFGRIKEWFSGIENTQNIQFDLHLAHHQNPPDLTILIEPIGEFRYKIFLISGIPDLNLLIEQTGDISFQLQTEPERYFEDIFNELNDWHAPTTLPDSEGIFFDRLNNIGTKLYKELFPEKLKTLYWNEIRNKVETIQIVSAESWIPWEIIRPYQETIDSIEEDDFLCERFSLTRWLAGGKSAPNLVTFDKIQMIMVNSDLGHMKTEKEGLNQLQGVQVIDTIPPSLNEVYSLLKTRKVDGIHFGCHGKYNRENPDQSILYLENDEKFRPSDISGEKRMFGRQRPLVFLNACETSQAASSLTGLGGWASAFIDAGASIFVGSSWVVNDEAASIFSSIFYNELISQKDNMTLGEATRKARNAIKRAGDPSWLSYTVYGDPCAKLITKRRLQILQEAKKLLPDS